MEKKKAHQSVTLLEEAAALKIHGGASSMDTNLTIYISSGCKKTTWADCKKICSITQAPTT